METIICGNCGCEGCGAQCFVCGAFYAEVGTAQARPVVVYAPVPAGDRSTEYTPIVPSKFRVRAKPAKRDLKDWERDSLVRRHTANRYMDYEDLAECAKRDGWKFVMHTDGKEKRVFAALCKELGIEVVKVWLKK